MIGKTRGKDSDCKKVPLIFEFFSESYLDIIGKPNKTKINDERKLRKVSSPHRKSGLAECQHQGLTLEELMEAGKNGLKKAEEKYNPKADSVSNPMPSGGIRQRIIQAIRKENNK